MFGFFLLQLQLQKEFLFYFQLCQFLSIIAEINRAVQDNDLEAFASLLTSPGANIEDVKEANLGQYMKTCKQKSPQLFNHGDLQEIIDDCNNNFTQIEAIREVNEAVEKCDVPRLKLALLNSDLALQVESLELSDDDTIHILCLMRDYKANLSLAENEERELWIEHIYDIVKDAIEHKNEAIRAGTALAIGTFYFFFSKFKAARFARNYRKCICFLCSEYGRNAR